MMEKVLPYCPICAEEISSRTLYMKPDMLYFESGTQTKGFIDIHCFSEHFLAPLKKKSNKMEILSQKIKDLFHDNVTLSLTVNKGDKNFSLGLYDESGENLDRACITMENAAGIAPILETIMEETPVGPSPSLVKLGGSPIPDAIFLEENYHQFQDTKLKILLDSNGRASSVKG